MTKKLILRKAGFPGHIEIKKKPTTKIRRVLPGGTGGALVKDKSKKIS